MKKIIVAIIMLMSVFITAQEKLNHYKYVVIPSRFDFQKTADEYNINTLLKLKFKQLGFDAYLDTDALPREVKTNMCSYLKPMLLRKSNMFKTTLKMQVLDCDNAILFETHEGVSHSKSYKIGYNEALRDALKSFGNYHLQYVKKEAVVVEAPKTVSELQAEVAALKKENNRIKFKPLDTRLPHQSTTEITVDEANSYLIAQSTVTGYRLVNSYSKKIEYILHSTKLKDIFIIKNNSGIIYKKEGAWVHEYVDKYRTVMEFLEIKFEK